MVAAGIIKGKFNDAVTAEFGNGFDADAGIRANNPRLESAINLINPALRVCRVRIRCRHRGLPDFSHHDEVDILITGRYTRVGFAGTQTNVQFQFFAQGHIDTAEA